MEIIDLNLKGLVSSASVMEICSQPLNYVVSVAIQKL